MRKFDELSRRQYAGPWHSACHEIGARRWQERKPINPLGEAVRTYTPYLAGRVKPKFKPGPLMARSMAYVKEFRVGRMLTDISFDRHLEDCVIDAMFGAGIMYCGLKDAASVFQVGEEEIDHGQFFTKAVSIGSFFCDPNADSFQQHRYCGHDYTACREWLLSLKIGNKTVLEAISNTWEDNEPRTAGTQKGTRSPREEEFLEDEIGLSEFTFRWQGRRFVGVLPPDNGPDEWVVEPYPWDGPDLGPYEFLDLNYLPRNQQPICPASVIMDAHLAASAVFARLVRQLETTRRKVVADPAAEEFVMKLRRIDDDEIIFGDPTKAKEVVFGGMVEEMINGYAVLDAAMKRFGPSVSLAGGQNDKSGTAYEASMRQGSTQVILGYWKGRRDGFVSNILRRASHYDTQAFEGPYQVPRTLPSGRELRLVVDPSNPAVRDTSWQDLEYSVYPMGESPMDPRMQQRSFTEMMGVAPLFLDFVGKMGGNVGAAVACIASIYEQHELTQILPVEDGRFLRQRLEEARAMASGMGAGAKGPAVGPGNQSYSNQMRSDTAAMVPAA